MTRLSSLTVYDDNPSNPTSILRPPSYTTAQIDLIPSHIAIESNIVYDSDLKVYKGYLDGQWKIVSMDSNANIVQSLPADPVNGTIGETYYNTTDETYREFSDIGWDYVSPLPGISIFGTAATLSVNTAAGTLVSNQTIANSHLFDETQFQNSVIKFIGSYTSWFHAVVNIYFTVPENTDTVMTFQLVGQNLNPPFQLVDIRGSLVKKTIKTGVGETYTTSLSLSAGLFFQSGFDIYISPRLESGNAVVLTDVNYSFSAYKS